MKRACQFCREDLIPEAHERYVVYTCAADGCANVASFSVTIAQETAPSGFWKASVDRQILLLERARRLARPGGIPLVSV